MNSHIKALGAIYLVWGGMGIIAGVIVLAIFVIGGGLMAVEDPEAGLVLGIIGAILIMIIAITSVPNLVAGWALIKHKSWGRILTIILSILNVFAFPLGTALGVYGLWVLFQPEAIQILEGRPTVGP